MNTSTIKIWGVCLSALLVSGMANAQFSFSSANARLNNNNLNIRSGNSVTIVDVNNDDLDDIVILDQNRYVKIEYQQAGGTFTYQYIGDFGTSTTPWGMSTADVDHNGYKDV